MATHCNILACEIPWREEPGGLQSVGSQRVGQDWATNTHTHTHIPHKGHTLGVFEQLKAVWNSSKASPGELGQRRRGSAVWLWSHETSNIFAAHPPWNSNPSQWGQDPCKPPSGPIPCLQTSDLQNWWGKMHFCCLSCPACGILSWPR